MDKILDFSDYLVSLNGSANNFNAVFLLPVAVAVVSVVAVFLYGFKRPESPKLRSVAGGNNSLKRKKRQATSNSGLSTVQTAATPETTQREKSANKKETSNLKAKKPQITKMTPKTTPRIVVKNTSKSNQMKPKVNELHKNDDEGEWQTVITKKQKKQPASVIPDLLIQAVAEVAAVVSKKSNKESKKTTNNQSANAKIKTNSYDKKKPQNVDSILKESTDITNPIPAADRELLADTTPLGDVTVAATTESATTIALPGQSNVAFDEIGDAWMENKPQRKNKKRALRE